MIKLYPHVKNLFAVLYQYQKNGTFDTNKNGYELWAFSAHIDLNATKAYGSWKKVPEGVTWAWYTCSYLIFICIVDRGLSSLSIIGEHHQSLTTKFLLLMTCSSKNSLHPPLSPATSLVRFWIINTSALQQATYYLPCNWTGGGWAQHFRIISYFWTPCCYSLWNQQ